ncbi:MAG: hypothetical protein K2H38_09835 [Muribaculaceae bacterium]|nr:hypothetical protein [Muribaculaceae bacterium]MDE6552232.1 hypothetical protein [Muribaculaceae bacterium]
MKFKFSRYAASAILFAVSSTVEIFPQSVRYNGDIEAGVVATRKYAAAQVNAATTHGAYFARPKLFIGAGASIGWNIQGEFWEKVYPIYGAVRKDFTINRLFTAFIDTKIGYSFQGDNTGVLGGGIDYGFYCYPAAGLRFAIGEQYGLYLKVGYTYQNATDYYLWWADGHKFEGSHKYNAGGFSASLGFSF